MYITFVRTGLELTSFALDGCNSLDSDLLEKVQLSDAQIITGLPKLASRNPLFLETGLELYISKRTTAELATVYKVHNNDV
jgi:hypothetical protein